MSDEPLIHIVRVDIEPAHEAAFNEWYDTVHIPEILACPGWLSACRFVTVDEGPKYAAMYEVAGTWVYDTPEFRAVAGFGAFEPHIRGFQRIQLKPIAATVRALRRGNGKAPPDMQEQPDDPSSP